MKLYYGKYRGRVENNIDPERKGRIQVSVARVTGRSVFNWAMPCVPYAGPGKGFFAIPPRGASVWVEFEAGDPDRPIWSGCFWDKRDDPPDSLALPDKKFLKTDSCTLTLDDTPGAGGITIETSRGMKIVLNALGIEISNGTRKVKITTASVSINEGALEVT
jgi:uncharacterized protein involved in type VI secretion and phage assembly